MRGKMRGGYNRSFHGHHFKYHNQKPFIPHVPFDLIQAENSFQRVKPAADDKTFNDALMKRNQDLLPNANDQTNLLNLVTKVQALLDNLVVTADFEACHLDEVRQVGSFKKGTMLSNKQVADIVVILKTLPTKLAVAQLSSKIHEELLKTNTPTDTKYYVVNVNEQGFEISCDGVSVQILITTQLQNIKKFESDLHMDSKICLRNLSSVKHAKWFEENVSNINIKILIRLLKDLRNRFEGMKPLNPWIIDLMAHYAITNNPKHEPLNLTIAFRRVLQIVSSGFFLPGSAGLADPCEGAYRIHTVMTLQEQDMVCYTCQTLLRVLAQGGFKQILGLEGNSSIATSTSVFWTGVVITPSEKAYELKENENQKYETDTTMDMN